MITNGIRDKIVEVSAKLITDRLSHQAHEQVIENFCLPQCGCTPDVGELCDEAEMIHRLFVALLFKAYGKLN